MGAPGAALGIDLGGTKTLGVVLDAPGRLVARTERATDTSSPEAVLATVVHVARRLLTEVEASVGSAGTIESVGVGSPGIVDAAGVIRSAVNLGVGASGLALRDLLQAELDAATGQVPVRMAVAVENDLNAAALGAGAVLGVDDLAVISVGTGIAAGLLLDGRLRRGRSGLAGEIGHVPAGDGAPCGCGSRGCLEARCSGPAIARRWAAAGGRGELFAAAAGGDAAAVAVRDDVLDDLARAIAGVVLHVDPGLVALTGGVTAAVGFGDALHDALDRLERSSPVMAAVRLGRRVRVLDTDPPAGAIGAAIVGRLARGGAT